MISFEPTGPLTLETFTDRDGNGGHGGRAEPKKIADNVARTVGDRRNGSGKWAMRKTLYGQ